MKLSPAEVLKRRQVLKEEAENLKRKHRDALVKLQNQCTHKGTVYTGLYGIRACSACSKPLGDK